MNPFVRRLIALGEIVQGLVPLFFAGYAIEAFAIFRHVFPDEPLVLRILQSGFYAGICLLTSLAGVLLWRSRPLGLKLSVLAQIAQIPVVATTAFSYAVKLNFGIWLFCNFDTGLVGFTASLVDNSEFALILGVHRVAPVVEVNVLAVCILLWLLRAIRRERLGYVEPRRKPLRGRALSFASRTLLVLLAIVLVPLLGLWIYNRVDEAPTQSAQHWFAPMQRSVPDNENAWLYMLGIGAAGSDDPIAFGRQRLDAYEARIAKPGFSPPSAEEHALESDPLPFQQNDKRGNKVEFCDPDERDCLAWAKTTAGQLTELESANAVLLQRYVALLAMTRFDELTTPSADDPLPNPSKEAALYRVLVLRDLENPATRDQGLQRLVRVVAFWQRAEEPAQSEFMKAFAEHERERYMRILDALVDQSGEKGMDSLNETIDVVLRAPAPAQREWEPALHREALKFATVMGETVLAGPIDSMRYCKSDCLKDWLIAQFYVPQATRNLYASLWDCVLDVHNGDPRNTIAAQARYTEIFESAMPLTKSAAETMHRMSYNASGKVLTLISLPAFADYLNRQHDTEALRRMLLVKIAALRQHAPVRDIPGFLAQQPSSLRNPYTGEPFGWDATRSQIVFAPKSKKWNASEFAVAYTPVADANRLASQVRHLAQPEKR